MEEHFLFAEAFVVLGRSRQTVHVNLLFKERSRISSKAGTHRLTKNARQIRILAQYVFDIDTNRKHCQPSGTLKSVAKHYRSSVDPAPQIKVRSVLISSSPPITLRAERVKCETPTERNTTTQHVATRRRLSSYFPVNRLY